MKENLLYYRTDEYEPWCLILPKTPYQDKIVYENHSFPITGHPGFVQTYAKIARLYYWPGMSNDIQKHIKECHECQ